MKIVDRVVNPLLVVTCVVTLAINVYPRITALLHAPRPAYKVGQVVNDLPGILPNQKTLVVGVWADCSVCNAELPTYQKLAQTKEIVDGRVKVLEFFPQPNARINGTSIEASQEFLKKTAMPAILEVPSKSPFIGTPQLYLLDENKRVVWGSMGNMSPDQEKKLFGLLGEAI